MRPCVDKLLTKLAQKYEIILWSDDDIQFIFDVIPKIKAEDKIDSAFGRECFSWTLQEGYQENLRYLNRELRNAVVIDKNI